MNDLTPEEPNEPPAGDWDARFPWVRSLLVWTGLAVVQSAVVHLQMGVPLHFLLLSDAVKYYSFAAASVLVWRACRWVSFRRWGPVRVALSHLALGALVVAGCNAAYALHLRLAMGPRFWDDVLAYSWMFQLVSDVTVYCALLATTLAAQASRRGRAQERREARLRLMAREAELAALRAQLQPHFLFNTLNSIVALVEADPVQARGMLVRLSELLQAVFDEMEEALVPLSRELALLEAYLGLERLRFGDRLTTRIDVPAAARDVLVPPFLLQPLVENALKHGIGPYAGGGDLSVTGRVEDGRLTLEVADSGPGVPPDEGEFGRGISLTRRRLEGLYGVASQLAFERRDGRFVARVDLPAATP